LQVNFFTERYTQGVDSLRREFSGDADLIRGYKSPNYFPHPLVPFRLASTIPNIKLVLLLREPLSRSISAHAMGFEARKEARPLDQALREELAAAQLCLSRQRPRVSCMWDVFYPTWRGPGGLEHDAWRGMANKHGSYLYPSLYALQLRHWLRSFRLSQFHIVSSKAFQEETKETMAGLASFLGLAADPAEDAHADGRVNEAVLTSRHRTKKASSAQGGRAKMSLTPETAAALAAFFEPFSEELWSLLGRRLEW
jgi:hypothetical protein